MYTCMCYTYMHPCRNTKFDAVFIDVFILQVPTLYNKQGAQFFAVSLLVVSRTWISDRIASLNGKNIIQATWFSFYETYSQDKLNWFFAHGLVISRHKCKICSGAGQGLFYSTSWN